MKSRKVFFARSGVAKYGFLCGNKSSFLQLMCGGHGRAWNFPVNAHDLKERNFIAHQQLSFSTISCEAVLQQGTLHCPGLDELNLNFKI